jgi:hypothetical protein
VVASYPFDSSARFAWRDHLDDGRWMIAQTEKSRRCQV